MAEKIQLVAQPRQETAGRLRRAHIIPAVLYGHNVKAFSLQVDAKAFAKVFQRAGFTSLINVTLDDGRDHTVLLRDVQHHPLRGEVTHVDFYQVRLDEAIRAKVPLKFVGESDAVKNQGGVLMRSLDEIELEALPADLPHDIEVDISGLTDFEKIIHISNLKLPSSVKHFHAAEDIVALVQAPRTEAELEALKTEVKEEVAAVEGVVKPEAEASGEAKEAGKEEKKAENKEEKK